MQLTKDELVKLREKVMMIKQAGEIEKLLDHKTAYQRFKEVATKKPDAIAIKYFGSDITYRQMLNIIDTAAKGFSEIGITHDSVVTTSLLATPYGIASFYALDKIGAVMHMVNAAGGEEELKRELSNFDSSYFVCTDVLYSKRNKKLLEEIGVNKVVTTSLLDAIPAAISSDKIKYSLIHRLKGVKKRNFDGKSLISFEQLLNIGRKSKKNLEETGEDANKISVVSYTSGSNGKSKACKATVANIDAMIQIMGMTEINRFEDSDSMFSTFPLWINYSLINMIHEPLSLGVTVALDPLFDPKDIAKRNKLYKFNHWLTIPPYIKTMIESTKKIDCSKWKIVVTGGDTLNVELKEKADRFIAQHGGVAKVQQGYGSTEQLGSVAYGYYENPTPGSLGVPCVGNMVKILDVDTLDELGPNQSGVAYFYSAATMIGYHNDEDATRKSLRPDANGVIWYNTDDLMHMNEKGELFMDGRIRRIVLTMDKNGNPAKIIPERTKKSIMEMPEIDSCEVITVADNQRVNRPVAFIMIKPGINLETIEDKVVKYCKEMVPEYMVPREVFVVDTIPLTTSKKSDIPKLEKMYEDIYKRNNSKTKKLLKK